MNVLWRYHAVRPDGARVEGLEEGASSSEVSRRLAQYGLFPFRISPEGLPGVRRTRVSTRIMTNCFQSLHALLDAGLSLDQALAGCESAGTPSLQELLSEAREGLRRGRPLADAMYDAGMLTPGAYGVLRAGERSGRIGETVSVLARQMAADLERWGRLQQALAYPTILLLTGMASATLIMTSVLPRFADLLSDAGQTLPPATAGLLVLGTLTRRFGLIAFVALLGAAGAFHATVREGTGQRWWHELLLRLPLVGPLRWGWASSRVLAALGSMLSAGMPLLVALSDVQLATTDVAIRARLARARDRVSSGERLARALATEHACAPVGVRLIAVGEQGGRLAPMATRAADLAGQEVERRLQGLVTLLEPSLVIALGGLVAFVAAALLQAVYALRPT